MKVRTNRKGQDELKIVVECDNHDELEKVLQALAFIEKKIEAIRNQQRFMISMQDILYFDTVDKKTFLYTEDDVYEIQMRLYEIETALDQRFIRINKSCVMNFEKLISLRADIGGRIMITLSNGEKLSVSRQYASNVKRKLRGE